MSLDSPPAVWWVRRDFRLCDNPALHAVVEDGGTILPLFIVDPVLQRSPGAGRGPWLLAALAALDSDLRRGGAPGLNVVGGRPSEVIPRIVQQSGAQRVHISADFAPYGRRRDAAVQRALARAGKELRATGSPYAIAPGNLYNEAGQPFQVFSQFHYAWLAQEVQPPAPDVAADSVEWVAADDRLRLEEPDADVASLAGEQPARQSWYEWRHRDPLIDAGMRQLLAEGWMHNRVRMVVASFLIKDLHLGWLPGAEWFMDRLRDGDLAQNHLNWQWVAGSGTDPAPYFRIFNPITQSERFDPDGTYIHRYLPELIDVPLEHLHQPWKNPAGLPAGYPPPIVDHAAERKESLDRFAAVKRR